MKKIIIAAMSLSLLTGTVAFAQMGTSTEGTMKKKMKHKKMKKSTSTDTMSAPK